MARWEPFKDLIAIQEQMNHLFEESLARSRGQEERGTAYWSPAVDIYETGDHLVIKAEIPGLSRKDITLEVTDNQVTLSGERRFEEEIKSENYHRLERAYGPFKRCFPLPYYVDQDKVSAKFKDGILEVIFPKKEEVEPKKITVKSD